MHILIDLVLLDDVTLHALQFKEVYEAWLFGFLVEVFDLFGDRLQSAGIVFREVDAVSKKIFLEFYTSTGLRFLPEGVKNGESLVRVGVLHTIEEDPSEAGLPVDIRLLYLLE